MSDPGAREGGAPSLSGAREGGAPSSQRAEPLGRAPGPLVFRAIAALVGLLPYAATGLLGRALGAFFHRVIRLRRGHVEGAMRRAGLDAGRAAPAMFASLGRGLFELLWLAGRPASALDDRFVFGETLGRAIDEARAEGKGVIIATAHTGNWDLTACGAARWLAERSPLHVVTKRLRPVSLDRFWQRLRAERGVILHDADGATRPVREALARGDVVALLVDQVPERASGVATFEHLGAGCRHDLAPAILAARAGVPMLAAFGFRDAAGVHRVELARVVRASELRGGRRAIVRATESVAEALEAFVRTHPEQWLWLHRRWRDARPAALRRSRRR